MNQGASELPGDLTQLLRAVLRADWLHAGIRRRSVPQFNGNVSRVRWKMIRPLTWRGQLNLAPGTMASTGLVAAHHRVGGASDRGFDESGIVYGVPERGKDPQAVALSQLYLGK